MRDRPTIGCDILYSLFVCLFLVRQPPIGPGPPHSRGFQITHNVGRTPLDECSARRTDLYLTLHNTHNGQTSILLVGFEPTISAGEWPQTYALDRAAIGTDIRYCQGSQIKGGERGEWLDAGLWLRFNSWDIQGLNFRPMSTTIADVILNFHSSSSDFAGLLRTMSCRIHVSLTFDNM